MELLTLCDLDAPAGRKLLEATAAMGFSPEVARAGLETELAAWTERGAIERVRGELPPELPPERLPRRVLVIAARTLPASAMRSVLMARLLGATVFVKPARGQEALAEALAEADPQVRALPFVSSYPDAVARAVAEADTVVVLGSDETIASLKDQVAAHQTFVPYGHRVSAAWVEEIDELALRGLAQDLCAWDQLGCLSPQVVWTPIDPRDLAARVAGVVSELETNLPMTVPIEAVNAVYGASLLGATSGRVFETKTSRIIALGMPRFKASPGYRTLYVLPADPAALQAVSPLLSALGYSGPPANRPDLGAGTRICALGEMQRPPLDWPHDGRPNLLPLLRPA